MERKKSSRQKNLSLKVISFYLLESEQNKEMMQKVNEMTKKGEEEKKIIEGKPIIFAFCSFS